MRKLLSASAIFLALVCHPAVAEISVTADAIPDEELTDDQRKFLKAAKFFLFYFDTRLIPNITETAHLRRYKNCAVFYWWNGEMWRVEFDKMPAPGAAPS